MGRRVAVPEPRAKAVRVDERELVVDLVDGRRIAVPLEWFPRLARAERSERDAWRMIGDGAGIRWEALDEDISVAGLLEGTLAPGGRRSREGA